MDQIAKVLKEDGIAIISTPNIEIYGGTSHLYGRGSYHQHEMNKKEFLDVLCTRFDQVYILGQAYSEISENRWRAMRMATILKGLWRLNFRPIIRDEEYYKSKSDIEFSIYNLSKALMFIALCRFPHKRQE